MKNSVFIYQQTGLLVSPVNTVKEMNNVCKSWIHPDVVNATFTEASTKEVLLAYAVGTQEEITELIGAKGYKMAHPAYMLGYIMSNPVHIHSGDFKLTTLHSANSFENKLGNSGMFGKCILDFRNNQVQFQTSKEPSYYSLCLLQAKGNIMGWHMLVEKA